MATKHIPDPIWRQVEKKTLEWITDSQQVTKAEEMLKWLIMKGLEDITEEDIARFRKKKTAGTRGKVRV